jgi:hypothetical protein
VLLSEAKALLPTNISILSIPHTIVLQEEPIICGDASYQGVTDLAVCTITISVGGRPYESILETLLHEVLHIIVYRMHVRIDREESVINVLASGLLQFLISNDGLSPKFYNKQREGVGIHPSLLLEEK